jgi:hypothetical protein
MKSNITELLGLPGTGKSYSVCGASEQVNFSRSSHVVASGVNRHKFYNTCCGFRVSPMVCGLLTILFIINIKRSFSFTEARPYLVILERLGRNHGIKIATNDHTFVDEGTLQFVWRIFCNLELNRANLFLGGLILNKLIRSIDGVEYFMVCKARHSERVASRNKKQKFDIALLEGNSPYLKSCRDSMYCLIMFLRNSPIKMSVKRG